METQRANINNPENCIKILARMIAEAYLEELSQKTSQQTSPEERKEVDACQSKG